MTLLPSAALQAEWKCLIYTPSFVLEDGTVGEMLYDGKATRFAVFAQGAWHDAQKVALASGEVLYPYSARNNLVRNRIVLLPSAVVEYENERTLLEELQAFLHRYVDVSPLFERLCTYYVLFTWIYDDFNELPYLRVIGDAGSGKTRFLLTVGSVCYKPIFASGASTVSPLFRVLDIFRGTLLIDEGDFPQSDEKAEIVKILNNGNAKGFPVLRSEPTSGGREYNPRAYHVYGPKIIATRSLFFDRALESRCLTEEMGHRRLREDVPINLPPAFWEESAHLRNQLLYFRFRHLRRHAVLPDLVDRSVEPRLNQVFVPLLSIIEDTETVTDLKAVMHDYHRQFISDKGMDVEGQLLEIVAGLIEQGDAIAIRDLAHHFAEKYGGDYERKITPRWVGNLVRRKLHLKTERQREGYVIPAGEKSKIARLLERYGLNQSELNRLPLNPEEGSGERVNVVKVEEGYSLDVP